MVKPFLLKPFQKFFQLEAASGVVLFLAAVAAVLWANSPWKDAYFPMWTQQISFGLPGASLTLPLHSWINDGLMAIFFLLVGLEIKREWLAGELSDPRQASLPLMAATGGMLVPGLIYGLVINPPGSAFHAGWGIPMVTDIAFSLGVLSLLGNRIPLFLKVFLTALAIADDLGAVLIIALFYSSGLHGWAVAVTVLLVVILMGMNRAGVTWLPVYLLVGLGLWVACWHSGIHSTMAGVLLAASIPVGGPSNGKPIDSSACLPDADTQAHSPLQRLEQALHPWVTYGIMPLFALANAGVTFSAAMMAQSMAHPVAWGIVAGLVLGKPLGITAFSWLSVQCGLAKLPAGIRWLQLVALACLGGVGFTMSLFIADLAFVDGVGQIAKVGIMAASLAAALLGGGLLCAFSQSGGPVGDERAG